MTGIHIGIFALSLGAALLLVTEGAWFEADLDLVVAVSVPSVVIAFVVVLALVREPASRRSPA